MEWHHTYGLTKYDVNYKKRETIPQPPDDVLEEARTFAKDIIKSVQCALYDIEDPDRIKSYLQEILSCAESIQELSSEGFDKLVKFQDELCSFTKEVVEAGQSTSKKIRDLESFLEHTGIISPDETPPSRTLVSRYSCHTITQKMKILSDEADIFMPTFSLHRSMREFGWDKAILEQIACSIHDFILQPDCDLNYCMIRRLDSGVWVMFDGSTIILQHLDDHPSQTLRVSCEGTITMTYANTWFAHKLKDLNEFFEDPFKPKEAESLTYSMISEHEYPAHVVDRIMKGLAK